MSDYVYSDESIDLEKGTKIFLYTDGITEAENTAKDLYGEKNLKKTLAANTRQDIQTMVNTIICSVAFHVQMADQSDDITILAIHYEPETSK